MPTVKPAALDAGHQRRHDEEMLPDEWNSGPSRQHIKCGIFDNHCMSVLHAPVVALWVSLCQPNATLYIHSRSSDMARLMLVAAPAFVLLGALATSETLTAYARDFWEYKPPESAAATPSAGLKKKPSK